MAQQGEPQRQMRGDNVEFVVKAEEDLVLEGRERSIVRVRQNDTYSCLMMKDQRFAALFKHYSKHHGLPKSGLEFSFTNVLGPDDSPESVHLQKHDLIKVRRARASVSSTEEEDLLADHTTFTQDFHRLLSNDATSDVKFIAGAQCEEIYAHRVILSARSEYFEAMFSKESMRESTDGVVFVKDLQPDIVRKMLEFIYSNSLRDINEMDINEILELFELSERYLLHALKKICEAAAKRLISVDTAAIILAAAERFNAECLKEKCLSFILENLVSFVELPQFQDQVKSFPDLAYMILRAQAKRSADPVESMPINKRARHTSSSAFNQEINDSNDDDEEQTLDITS